MLMKEIVDKFNLQIAFEARASNAYLSMASWCIAQNLPDIGEYFYRNAEDERGHMLEIYRYANENGGHAYLGVQEAALKEYKDLFQVFDLAFKLERDNTQAINELAGLCMETKDFATFKFLEKFILEQRESENKLRELIHMIDLMGKDERNLYYINKFFKKLLRPAKP